jgi:hypothetical protein
MLTDPDRVGDPAITLALDIDPALAITLPFISSMPAIAFDPFTRK